MSILLGLLGRKLCHSASPAMFAAVLPQVRSGAAYVPWEVEPDRVADHLQAMRTLAVRGFNVTVPYKETIIPLLDGLAADAAVIRAVNCVVADPDGRLIGHNTDVAAFGESLQVELRGASPGRCLVLGAGGAAKAVVLALLRLGAGELFVVSRRAAAVQDDEFLRGNARHLQWGDAAVAQTASTCDLLVNATPLGMWPDADSCPLDAGFHKGQIVFDLVYNPRPTLFLRKAAAAGAITLDGLDMLARQAAESLRLWTGARVSHQKFLAAAEKIRS